MLPICINARSAATACLRRRKKPVTWLNGLEVMGLDENETDFDNSDEVKQWRPELKGASPLHFDPEVGPICGDCRKPSQRHTLPHEQSRQLFGLQLMLLLPFRRIVSCLELASSGH